MTISHFHAKYPGGIRWRVVPGAVEGEGQGIIRHDQAIHSTATAFLQEYAAAFAASSKEYDVPVELLIACVSAQNPDGPRRFVWRDPGYVGDDNTPNLVSAGICRMLVSDARHFMKDSKIDRAWLLEAPNALRACAAYLRSNYESLKTDWDPVLVACAFNAGGLYEDKAPGNKWRLRQYSMSLGFHSIPGARVPDASYADQFCRAFSAANALLEAGALEGHDFKRFTLEP